MDLNEYQERARAIAKYPDIGLSISRTPFVYPAMGLVGKAGEIMQMVRRLLNNKSGKLGPATKNQLVKELGDNLWYLSSFATEIGVSLGWIAEENLKKLEARYEGEE